jgi:thioredoxin
MAALELTKDNFDEVVSNNDTVIVDFWAPWCGPCVGFAPIFEQASEKHPGVVFAKINTDEEQELAGHFQIRSIPILMVFREKIILFAQPGAMTGGSLEELITKVAEVDMVEIHKQVVEET